MEKTNFDKIVDYLYDCELPEYSRVIAEMTDIPLEEVEKILNSEYVFTQVKRKSGRPKNNDDVDYGAWFLDRKILCQMVR